MEKKSLHQCIPSWESESPQPAGSKKKKKGKITASQQSEDRRGWRSCLIFRFRQEGKKKEWLRNVLYGLTVGFERGKCRVLATAAERRQCAESSSFVRLREKKKGTLRIGAEEKGERPTVLTTLHSGGEGEESWGTPTRTDKRKKKEKKSQPV